MSSYSLEYSSWSNMKARCYNPNTNGYRNYGGKGIKVCDRWLKNFQAFAADMGPRPSIHYSIDRIDSNKNYEPANCRWILKSENSRHGRPPSLPYRARPSLSKIKIKIHEVLELLKNKA